MALDDASWGRSVDQALAACKTLASQASKPAFLQLAAQLDRLQLYLLHLFVAVSSQNRRFTLPRLQ